MLIEISIWIDGKRILEFVTHNLSESFYFQGNLLNGYLISYIILNTLWIHIPFLVAFVAGDLIAGEANNGTFRLVLTRPISRQSLLFAKFSAGLIYSTLLVLFLGLLSLIFGVLIFGKGDLIVIQSKINIIPQHDLVWRFVYAFLFGILSMGVVTSLAFMLSAFASNSIGPIIGTIAIIIVFSIITSFEIPVFSNLKPILFTSYLNSWRLFFEFELNKILLFKSIFHLILNLLIFYTISILYFKQRDILS